MDNVSTLEPSTKSRRFLMKVSNVSGKGKNSNRSDNAKRPSLADSIKSDNAKRPSLADSTVKYVYFVKLALNIY